ncbi:MAG: TrgA family protein [Rhodobacterales bacterium]|nr:TrgA family protein [Rhodobacterales bacterium]MDX5413812.1 TrgA family protein [Rhodobacterales bacterium]
MFTAPRLVAAVLLAGVGFVASDLIRPLMPEGTQFGWFNYVNAVLGAIMGWVVIGKRIGRGVSAAVGNGVTGAAALIFWGLFTQSVNEMLRLSLRRRYDGPVEALTDMLRIGAEWALTIATVPVMGTIFIGGIVAAVLAEVSARHWR